MHDVVTCEKNVGTERQRSGGETKRLFLSVGFSFKLGEAQVSVRFEQRFNRRSGQAFTVYLARVC